MASKLYETLKGIADRHKTHEAFMQQKNEQAKAELIDKIESGGFDGFAKRFLTKGNVVKEDD